MDDLQVLITFLTSLLPEAIVLKSVSLAAVVVSLVRLIRQSFPMVERGRRWAAPALAMLLGLIAGQVAVSFGHPLLGLGAGVLIGLTAIGLHSARKNVSQARTRPRRPPVRL